MKRIFLILLILIPFALNGQMIKRANPFAKAQVVTGGGSDLFDDQVAYFAMDETSGSTATDSEGSNDGTIKTNVTVNQTGKFSKAYTFESNYSTGTTQGIWCGTGSDFNLTTTGTIAAWIYFRGGQYAGVGCIAGTLDTDTETYGYMLMSDEDAGGNPRITMKLATSSAVQTFRNTTAYSADTWVHVVGSWNADSINIYINGANKQKVARTRTPNNTDAEFCIGRSRTEWQPKPWGWGRTTGDALDEIRVFSVRLTDSQVADLYEYEP